MVSINPEAITHVQCSYRCELADWRGQLKIHLAHVGRHRQGRLRSRTDLRDGDTRGDLSKHRTACTDVNDGKVSDDTPDAGLAGEGQRASVDDLAAAVLGKMLHHHN